MKFSKQEQKRLILAGTTLSKRLDQYACSLDLDNFCFFILFVLIF